MPRFSIKRTLMKKLLFVLFCYAGSARCQSPLPLPYAINTALQNSFDIQLAKNDVRINTIYNNYGFAGGLPGISSSAADRETVTSINQKYSDATRNVSRKGAGANSLNASVDASFLLYNGMRVKATKQRFVQLQLQSEQRLNSQIQNTIASVMTTYYDIVRQQGYIKTIDQSITVSRQRLLIIETQKSVGLANNADLYQAQIDLNALQQSKQSQQVVIDQSKTELLRLMNVKLDSAIVIEDTILADKTLLLDSVLAHLQSNADILAAEDQIKINEQIVRQTAAQRYPSVTTTTGYVYGRTRNAAGFTLLNQNYGPYIGLAVSIPIYNGTYYKRQQRAAEINTQNASLEAKTIARDYEATVLKNYTAYASSLIQLEAQKNVFDTAQKLLDIVMKRFELRVNTILEVRAAQQSFEEEGYRLVNLAFAAKASEIELKRLGNILSF